ncbi:MAG: hypothetical protein MJ214_05455 [Bacilli bacterium]|nr:hypothetical protein [Bacilli bacterium]
MLLVRLGLDTYNNKNFEQFSFTLYDVNKSVKEMNEFQIKLIARVEKVLEAIEGGSAFTVLKNALNPSLDS